MRLTLARVRHLQPSTDIQAPVNTDYPDSHAVVDQICCICSRVGDRTSLGSTLGGAKPRRTPSSVEPAAHCDGGFTAINQLE